MKELINSVNPVTERMEAFFDKLGEKYDMHYDPEMGHRAYIVDIERDAVGTFDEPGAHGVDISAAVTMAQDMGLEVNNLWVAYPSEQEKYDKKFFISVRDPEAIPF